ncbi:MAG: hypothetical protein AAGA96_08265 [Verrucomicrobiota bacterium]
MAIESAVFSSTLQCPTCRNNLNVNREIEQLEELCPVCRSEIKAVVFPRFFRDRGEDDAPFSAKEEESTCSFFPEWKAEKVCDECGCLMSKRAAVRWGDRDLCLPCLHRLREEEKDTSFVARSRLYDNRALALVTWLAPLTLFTAPVALFLLLRHRRNIKTFVPRSSARWWVAIVLSLVWMAIWLIAIAVWISLILDEYR